MTWVGCTIIYTSCKGTVICEHGPECRVLPLTKDKCYTEVNMALDLPFSDVFRSNKPFFSPTVGKFTLLQHQIHHSRE